MSIPTPHFTRAMMAMTPGVLAIYMLGRIANVLLPFGIILIERILFNQLGLATNDLSLWTVIATYVSLMVVRMGSIMAEAWGDVTFRYRLKGILHHNALQQALERPGAEPLPVSALEAINRLRDDVDEVADFPLWIPEVIATVGTGIVAFVVMSSIDLMLSIMSVIPLILLGVASYLIWPHYLAYRYQAGMCEDRFTSLLGSMIAGAQTITLANSSAPALERLNEISQERQRVNVRGHILFQAQSALVSLGIGICGTAIYWYGGTALSTGAIQLGDLLLLVSSLGIIAWVPNVIATFIGDYAQQKVSIGRLTEFMPNNPDGLIRPYRWWLPVRADSALAPRPALTELTLHNVSYTYPSSGGGIRNVNLTIPRGSLTVITGAVGSGKSTLLHLLSGLLAPQSGTITWNGQSITQLSAPQVLATTQIPFLVSDTLRENITLGAADNHLPQVLAASDLTHDITQLPDGLNTIVGPRGVRLSGGQRQRVALARMLLRPAEILVLDDISSAVDVTTEAYLWQSLRQHSASTLVASSHRRTLLQQADQIVVVTNGTVVALGRYEDVAQHLTHLDS
ncbi:MAG: ABC transporter ATP-binding protein [Roseiflexaceae bacterium]